MTFGSLLVVLFIFLLAGIIVFRPFLDSDMRMAAARSGRYDSLLAERERLYAAIEELDLNFELKKISAEEHTSGRNELLLEAAAVLKKIEEHPLSRMKGKSSPASPGEDDLERMIAERRKKLKSSQKDFCPACGEPISAGDTFCSSCGEKI